MGKGTNGKSIFNSEKSDNMQWKFSYLQDICAIRLDFCDFDIPAQNAGAVSSTTARLKVDGPTSDDPPLVNEGKDICKLKQLLKHISWKLFDNQNCP